MPIKDKDALVKYGVEYRRKNAEVIAVRRKIELEKNKEKIRAQKQAHYIRHAEKIKARVKQRRDADPQADRERSKAWYHANKEYLNEKSHQWREENKEHELAQKKKYYEKNKEYISGYGKRRYEEKKEEIKAKVDAYRRSHPEVYADLRDRRRARACGVEINDFTKIDWQIIKDAYENCCAYCGKLMERLTRDHIIPLAKRWNNTAANIVPACKSCNSKKGVGPPLIPLELLLVRHPYHQDYSQEEAA